MQAVVLSECECKEWERGYEREGEEVGGSQQPAKVGS